MLRWLKASGKYLLPTSSQTSRLVVTKSGNPGRPIVCEGLVAGHEDEP